MKNKLDPNKNYESKIQKAIHNIIGGVREVVIENGRIDILTDEAIIEVKDIKNWKHAIGQLKVYSLDYPDKDLIMYLFTIYKNEKVDSEYISRIKETARQLGIITKFYQVSII